MSRAARERLELYGFLYLSASVWSWPIIDQRIVDDDRGNRGPLSRTLPILFWRMTFFPYYAFFF